MILVVPEQSTAWLTVSFKDRDGNLQSPTSATYMIERMDGTEILPWTPISPITSESEITLTPSDNTIIDEKHDQMNHVIVKAIFGATDQRQEGYIYKIRNTKGD